MTKDDIFKIYTAEMEEFERIRYAFFYENRKRIEMLEAIFGGRDDIHIPGVMMENLHLEQKLLNTHFAIEGYQHRIIKEKLHISIQALMAGLSINKTLYEKEQEAFREIHQAKLHLMQQRHIILKDITCPHQRKAIKLFVQQEIKMFVIEWGYTGAIYSNILKHNEERKCITLAGHIQN